MRRTPAFPYRYFLLSLPVVILAFILLLPNNAAKAQGDELIVLTVEGPITRSIFTYIERGVYEAEESGANAIILQLDTPGGSVNATLDILEVMRNSDVPIIVYVGPAGAQAASAGTLITLGGHLSTMAPETVIGAASPINGDGSDINETSNRKLTEDLTAVVRSLTESRPPEAVALAESTIIDATAVTANEALDIGLIDLIATNRFELVPVIDGRTVLVNQQPWVLDLANTSERVIAPSFVESALQALTDPTFISILLGLAVPLILIELRAPGGWVAGFVGTLSLALALYGLGTISVNWLGLGFIAIAAVLFFLEVQSGTGVLAVVGTVTLIGGILILFNSPGTPDFVRVSIPAAITVGVLSGGTFTLFGYYALRAQRSQPRTGAEGLIGMQGRVQKGFVPAGSHYRGKLFINGELWNARASEALERHSDATVDQIDGFTLYVSGVANSTPMPADDAITHDT